MESKLFTQLPDLTTLPNTVEECHVLIRELAKVFSEFLKQVEKIAAENAILKERLNTNSSNSSLPPSKDRRTPPTKKRPPSSRPSGGQPGHPGHFRKMLGSSEVDAIVECVLPDQCVCGGKLVQSGDYERHQVYELPEIRLNVTEYQMAKGRCVCCKRMQIATLPEGITRGITGPRLTSFLAHLVSRYHFSRRSLQAFLNEQYDFKISLGTLFNKQRIINGALEEPVALLWAAIQESLWLNVDETGHRRDGKRQWLWGAMSSTAAYFSVEASRGKKTLRAFLGSFKHIVISDRYAAYNIFDSSQRQLCWAHLKRDFTRLAEKKERIIARLGKTLLSQQAELFSLWHTFKKEEISREELIERAVPIRDRVEKCLERGSNTDPQLRATRFCKNLLEQFEALWTFLSVEGVEPTNNHAERCLRPAVLWRKIYFGTRSDYGSEFVAKTASLTMTCALQSKNAFEYLCQATHHYFAKTTAPPFH